MVATDDAGPPEAPGRPGLDRAAQRLARAHVDAHRAGAAVPARPRRAARRAAAAALAEPAPRRPVLRRPPLARPAARPARLLRRLRRALVRRRLPAADDLAGRLRAAARARTRAGAAGRAGGGAAQPRAAAAPRRRHARRPRRGGHRRRPRPAQGWRAVAESPDGISAEKGYLREAGNLVFHLALIGLLVGFAGGKLFGYEGQVIVQADGGQFCNTGILGYDSFRAGLRVDGTGLDPFCIKVDDFTATYLPNGQAAAFAATIGYQSADDLAAGVQTWRPFPLAVNHPLRLDGERVYLQGHGYTPRFTVTFPDGQQRTGADPVEPGRPHHDAVGGRHEVPAPGRHRRGRAQHRPGDHRAARADHVRRQRRHLGVPGARRPAGRRRRAARRPRPRRRARPVDLHRRPGQGRLRSAGEGGAGQPAARREPPPRRRHRGALRRRRPVGQPAGQPRSRRAGHAGLRDRAARRAAVLAHGAAAAVLGQDHPAPARAVRSSRSAGSPAPIGPGTARSSTASGRTCSHGKDS